MRLERRLDRDNIPLARKMREGSPIFVTKLRCARDQTMRVSGSYTCNMRGMVMPAVNGLRLCAEGYIRRNRG